MRLPQTLNPYAYVTNNPVNLIDPSGEIPVLILAGLFVAGGFLGGAGAYTLYPYVYPDTCGHWDPAYALVWAGGGALLGAGMFGAGYGGWMLGVHFGWWTPAAGPLLDELSHLGPPSSPIRIVRLPFRGVWRLPGHARGDIIHSYIGENLPHTFKTFDNFKGHSGTAISIKSLNLGSPYYQDVANLTRKMYDYFNSINEYSFYTLQGRTLYSTDIASKVLDLYVPPGGTNEQWTALLDLQRIAYTNWGIVVRFTILE